MPADDQAAVWQELTYQDLHRGWRLMLYCQYKALVEAAAKLSTSENKRKARRYRPGLTVRPGCQAAVACKWQAGCGAGAYKE